MRFFLHIGYHGRKYHGWQRQPKVISVQSVLEDNLEKMLGQFTTCFGCGRTDAGVHANQYFLHINVEEEWDYDPVFRLNKMLPNDISIFEVIPMPDTAHARYDATERTYDYFLHRYKDPFLDDRSTFYLHDNLDIEKMNQAVKLIAKQRDFKMLCKQPELYNHTNCHIQNAQLFTDQSGDRLRFQITANRFLRGMIRMIMARLIDIGRGQLSLDEFAEHLESGERFAWKNSAYPQGLFLSKVVYPYLNQPPKSVFFNSIYAPNQDVWQSI